MNKDQRAVYDTGVRAKDFNAENQTALSAIQEYDPYLTLFNTIFGKIEESTQNQVKDITVIAPDKETQKAIMGAIVIKYTLRAAPKAHLIPNLQLEAGLSKPVTYITKANDDLAADRATELKDLMKNNLTDLDNLTQANIDEMEKAIKQFKDIKPVPKEAIVKKKTQGTGPLPGLLKELKDCMKQMGKLIHSYLPDLAPTWDAYVKKGKVPGKRYLSFKGHYIDDMTGVNLKKVKVTLTNGVDTIIKESSKLGHVSLFSVPEGNWTIVAELAGYEKDVKMDVGISMKKIVRMEVKLKKLNDAESTTGTITNYVYLKTNNKPVEGALVNIPDLHYVGKTDENGENTRNDVLPGVYNGNITYDGYKMIPFAVTVVAGETSGNKFYLEAEEG